MSLKESKYQLNQVLSKYNFLNLTAKQADLISTFEEEKDIFSRKHFFSVWELWDYELTVFQGILHPEQLQLYEVFIQDTKKTYEKTLIEEDKEIAYGIVQCEELIGFCESEFLPGLFKDPFLVYTWISAEFSKIDYLKKEYQKFLNDSKKALLINHFRHNRIFKPNLLKSALLKHKLSCILADYDSFKQQMDKPTLAIAAFLEEKACYMPDDLQALLASKFEELKNYIAHETEIQGWSSSVKGISKVNRAMTLLLMDNNKL